MRLRATLGAAVFACVLSALAAGETVINPEGVVSAHLEPADALYKSPVHLALSHDETRLYIVCEKADTVLVADTVSQEVITEIPVGKMPYGITLSPDGSRLYVSNRWDDSVSVIDTSNFEEVATIATGHDPHGLILDASGDFLYVTNFLDDDVSIISITTSTTIKRLRTGVRPVELALSPDGRLIYISNLMTRPTAFRSPPESEITIVDTDMQIVVDRRMLPGANISQGIAASPDGDIVGVALEIPKNLIPETQIAQGWMVTYGIAVLEARPGGRSAVLLLDEIDLYYADPFGLSFSPDGKQLFVSSSGVDIVSVIDVPRIRQLLEIDDGRIGISDEEIALNARHLGLSSDFVSARIATDFNPKGLIAARTTNSLYVANRLADSISIIDRTTSTIRGEIDLGGPPTMTTVRRGEYLFNKAVISFQRQLACNTCHPEHNVDGLLYDIAVDGGLGGNLVDNRTMRGVAFTGPFKWSGKNPSLKRQEGPRAAQLFFRSHGFTGADQDAVVAFIETIPVYPKPTESDEPTPAQLRGQQIFERERTNSGDYIPIGNRCITCHPPPFYTARQMNDVGTKAYFDTDGEFDTPQLNGVLTTPPYLHDGRCWSLEEIWTLYNPYDLHGVANDLTKQQLNDLIEFLKTL